MDWDSHLQPFSTELNMDEECETLRAYFRFCNIK